MVSIGPQGLDSPVVTIMPVTTTGSVKTTRTDDRITVLANNAGRRGDTALTITSNTVPMSIRLNAASTSTIDTSSTTMATSSSADPHLNVIGMYMDEGTSMYNTS